MQPMHSICLQRTPRDDHGPLSHVCVCVRVDIPTVQRLVATKPKIDENNVQILPSEILSFQPHTTAPCKMV